MKTNEVSVIVEMRAKLVDTGGPTILKLPVADMP